jgi:hypothetical protein
LTVSTSSRKSSPCARRGREHDRRLLERRADERHLDAAVVLDPVRGEKGLPRIARDHVRGEHAETGAGERSPRLAAICRTAALLHAAQVRRSAVEFVVTHAVEIEAGEVHRLYRRLFVERGRRER